MVKRGHIPVRQCVGCRARRPASEMIRLKEQDHAVVVVGQRQSIPGRGCYVCPSEKCIGVALKKGAFSRALRRNISTVPSKESLLQRTGTEEVTG